MKKYSREQVLAGKEASPWFKRDEGMFKKFRRGVDTAPWCKRTANGFAQVLEGAEPPNPYPAVRLDPSELFDGN